MVQYITYFPAEHDPLYTEEFQRVMRTRVKSFGRKFYDCLTFRGKQVCGFIPYDQIEEPLLETNDDPNRQLALKYFREGEQHEQEGDRTASISCFSKAFKLCPDLEVN